MLFSRLSLMIVIMFFALLVINVIYVLASVVLLLFGCLSALLQPVMIVLIPLELFTCMFSLLYACDYNDNVEKFVWFSKGKAYYVFLYASGFLLNTLMLYVYTKSYNNYVRLWGILRCFPFVNVFLYRKLVKRNVEIYKEMSNWELILLYAKGRLLSSLMSER